MSISSSPRGSCARFPEEVAGLDDPSFQLRVDLVVHAHSWKGRLLVELALVPGAGEAGVDLYRVVSVPADEVAQPGEVPLPRRSSPRDNRGPECTRPACASRLFPRGKARIGQVLVLADQHGAVPVRPLVGDLLSLEGQGAPSHPVVLLDHQDLAPSFASSAAAESPPTPAPTTMTSQLSDMIPSPNFLSLRAPFRLGATPI